MERFTLELHPQKSSGAGEVLLELFGGTTPLERIVLEQAFHVFKPRALDFIWHISKSDDLDKKSHELWVDYRTSFIDADFEANDELTPLGQYLKEVDGCLHDELDEDLFNLVLESVRREHYWNPEWPMPRRIKLGWEHNEPPFELTVVCEADSDEQLAHLLLHNHLDDILNGMLPILEEFLNRTVQEIIRSDCAEE